ncbi:MAG: hypothetical protein CMO81_08020 [Waddliaceae bacterium]|nr:hypothetical protein [Waddliaceae bacterium]
MSYFRLLFLIILLYSFASVELAANVEFKPGMRTTKRNMTHLLFPMEGDLVIEIYVSAETGRYEQFHVTFFNPFSGYNLRKNEFAHFIKRVEQISGIPEKQLHHLMMKTLNELKRYNAEVRQRKLPMLDTEYFQEGNWMIFGRTGLNAKEQYRINHLTIKGYRIDSPLLQEARLNIFEATTD